MSNSRWRIVGVRQHDQIPYSNSAHESEEAGRAYAERQSHSGFTPFAIMPESESVMVTGGLDQELMQNMEKVLHSHPEWFFDDQSEDRYVEWKRLNGYASAGQTTTIGPRKPKPQLPPEVWAKPNPNTDYMAAVRAMCGEGRKGE